MKRLNILLCTLFICMMWSCRKEDIIFAPDGLYSFEDNPGVWVANRSGNELILFTPELQKTEKKITFTSPVNDVIHIPEGNMWAITDGYNGKLYEIDADKGSILSETTIGDTPSALVYNQQTGSLWVAQRFKNRLLEIDLSTCEAITQVKVGREPVDLVTFGSDNFLLVANNMPEMASTNYPVAAGLSIVDSKKKEVTKRITLPNGSTDIKAIAMNSGRSFAYVTHLLARYQLPTNQVDRGWMSTNALSIIDLISQELVTTILLDTPQKGTANPWGVTVSGDDSFILVAASGAHEIVSIDRLALHEQIQKVKEGIRVTPSTRKWEDIPNDAGFLYGICNYIPTQGKGPRAILATEQAIYSANYFTGEMLEINPETGKIEIRNLSMPNLVSTKVGEGNMYFHDATLGFQGWQSCASCHPNDARIDGLNWDLLNDGIGNPKNTKSLLYSHQTPPCMVTGIRKNAETAVRSGLKYILFSEANEKVSSAMDIYLKSLSAEPSPYLVNGNLSEAAQRGKKNFNKHCASCHSGGYYTNGKLYEIDWAEINEKDVKMDVSTLNEVWRTAPYLYDGRAYTMQEMLRIHGPEVSISESEIEDLAEYVLSL